MQIRNYFALVLMLFSTASFAAGSVQMFASKSECLRHFTLSSGTSDVAAGDKYCKDKVVKSAADICADKKLLDFKMKNSISSVQEAQYLQKFKLECVSASTTAAAAGQQANSSAQTAERDAQIAAQKAAMLTQQQQAQAAQAAAAAAAAAKAQGATPQQQQAAAAKAQLDMINALLPAVDKVATTYDKAAAQQKKEAATEKPATAAEKPEAATTAAVESTPAAAPSTAEATASEAPTEGSFVDPAGNKYEMVENKSDPTRPYIEKTDVNGNVTTEPSLPADASAVQAGTATVATDLPGAADAAKTAGSTVDTPPTAGAVTDITTSSNALSAEEAAEIKQLSATAQQLTPKTDVNYSQMISAIKEFDAKWESFSNLKKTCTKLAESSSFLCMEGTSPGAQAAKALVSVAGPILGAAGSVVKACSNTKNVMDLAQKVTTIAQGTCVVAKTACDAGCSAAAASLAALKTMATAMTGKASSDYGNADHLCEARYSVACDTVTTSAVACPKLKACLAENQAKKSVAQAAIQKYNATLAKETPPTTPGTVPNIAAKCTANVKDIVMLGLNALIMANASKSAKECEKKVASNGAGGGNVTPTQYCETPGNSGTQFCKCQQNANQEGCPGFAGKGSLIDKNANKESVAGVNLKSGKGLSSFAGGSRGAATGFGPNGKQEYNPSAPGTGEKLALTGGDAAAAGAGGAYGGGGAGGGGSSAGGGAGEGTGGKPEDKKWSFGSFANALGGMFGGGSGGKGSNSKGNGNLNSKQEAAIKRKLASDRLAGEITSASGKSNWEKVHQVYKIKDSTLITGN